jgi:transposase
MATRITLRGSERRTLQRVVRAHTSEQRMVLRARIVLLAQLAWNNGQIVDELGCDLKTVRKWRDRFAASRLEGLWDCPRSGRPSQFTTSQRHDVFAAVVGPPPSPYARWTVDLLANDLTERGIVPSIGRETVSLWLRTADVKPHRVKYWLTSKDPEFKPKKDRIIGLYLKPPKDGIVISIDEKTSIQALERTRPGAPPLPHRNRRIDFEYKRHGVVNLIAAFAVHTGDVVGECIEKNDSAAFIRFIRRIMKVHPRRKLYLILDNGTTHRSKETTAFFARYPRLVPVFTPTHASWLNQVEIWFSMLSRQALRNVSFQSRDELRKRILQFIDTYNRTARPFNWTSKGQPLAGRRVKVNVQRTWGTQRRRSIPPASRMEDHYPAPTPRRSLGSK